MGTGCGHCVGRAITNFLTAESIPHVPEQSERARSGLSGATTVYSYCSSQYLDTVPTRGTWIFRVPPLTSDSRDRAAAAKARAGLPPTGGLKPPD